MSKPRVQMVVAANGESGCIECSAAGEKTIGKAAITVRTGHHYSGLCLAHAIQLSLDIRREVRKSYPSALNH